MALLHLAAAAGFACLSPSHHDGDAIRCANTGKSMRLDSIDAPEMPGACRPGRDCTPGDPFAARDYLASLTAGRSVTCEQTDIDRYGRRVVRCEADGVDLSCAMVAGGHAVERYGALNCGGQSARSEYAPPDYEAPAPYTPPKQADATPSTTPPDTRYYAPTTPAAPRTSPVIFGALWLLLINLAAYAAFAFDKHRAIAGGRRIPESTLLTLALLGGSPGAISAQQRLRHKTHKQPFANRLLAIAGLQIGVIVGVIALYFW